MIYQKAPNEELIKEVDKDRERLHKEAEEALNANKKDAEEIEKYHGEDTKKPITNNNLKAMHLSESLFDDAPDIFDDFSNYLYRVIENVCNQYSGITEKDVQKVFDEFLEDYSNFSEDNDFEDVPGFEGTMDDLDGLSLFGESMKTKNLNEGIKRYSDTVPYEERKYWYFTTHGVGPGAQPKDLNIIDVRYGQNDKGTWGTFVCLDGVLNTSELKQYDMKEMKPLDLDDSLDEEFNPYEGF